MRCAVAALGAGAALVVLGARGAEALCVLPAFGGEGRSCAADAECCGAARCVARKCVVDGDAAAPLSAAGSAAVAHLMAQGAAVEVAMVADFLNNAAAGVAAASDKLEKSKAAAAAKASGMSEAAAAAQAKAKELLEQSKAALAKLKEQADAAKLKASAEAAALKEKALAAMHAKTVETQAKLAEAVHLASADKGQEMTPEQKQAFKDKMLALQKAADEAMDALKVKLADVGAGVGAKAEAAAASDPSLKDSADAVASKATEVADKSAATIDRIKAKYHEIMRNITSRVALARNVENKAATKAFSPKGTPVVHKAGGAAPGSAAPGGGFSYGGFTMGGSGTAAPGGAAGAAGPGAGSGASGFGAYIPSMPGLPGLPGPTTKKTADAPEVEDKAAAPAAPAAGAGAGASPFDYKSFMPGAGGAGGAASPFDYAKFIPGGAAKNATTAVPDAKSKGKNKNSAVVLAGEEAVAPEVNDAAGAAAPGGFAGAGAKAAKTRMVGFKMMAEIVQMETATGVEDAVVTEDRQFNFGVFIAEVASVNVAASAYPAPDWTKFAPPMPSNKAAATAAAPAATQPSEQGGPEAQPAPGAEGAPCGMTPYKDFGECNKGLHCQVTPLFSAFAPGKCVPKSQPSVVKLAEEGSPALPQSNDAEAAAEPDPQAVAEASKKVAEAANMAALKAADAAEVLAAKLLAAAAQVREAAAKLMKEADDVSKAGAARPAQANVAEEPHIAMLADAPASSSHWTLYILAAVGLGGGYYAWRQSSANQYRRL
jgi:hypothetical protein